MALVRPLRLDGTDDPAFEYPEPLAEADGVAAAGFYPQTGSGLDTSAGIERNGTGALVLKDSITGSKTLAQLVAGAAGGVSLVDFLLDEDPVAEGVTYTATWDPDFHLVTAERWEKTVGGAAIKTVAYTYTGILVTQVLTRVYDAAGAVVVGQTTETLTYTAGRIVGSTKTRDI